MTIIYQKKKKYIYIYIYLLLFITQYHLLNKTIFSWSNRLNSHLEMFFDNFTLKSMTYKQTNTGTKYLRLTTLNYLKKKVIISNHLIWRAEYKYRKLHVVLGGIMSVI